MGSLALRGTPHIAPCDSDGGMQVHVEGVASELCGAIPEDQRVLLWHLVVLRPAAAARRVDVLAAERAVDVGVGARPA